MPVVPPVLVAVVAVVAPDLAVGVEDVHVVERLVVGALVLDGAEAVRLLQDVLLEALARPEDADVVLTSGEVLQLLGQAFEEPGLVLAEFGALPGLVDQRLHEVGPREDTADHRARVDAPGRAPRRDGRGPDDRGADPADELPAFDAHADVGGGLGRRDEGDTGGRGDGGERRSEELAKHVVCLSRESLPGRHPAGRFERNGHDSDPPA